MSTDLIDVDRARQNIPTAVNTDEPTISTLITAACRAIEKYCRREFVQETYDELYNGTGDRRLILNRFPLVSVQSVRYRPVTALKVQNTQYPATPIARVTVTNTGITLMRVAAGVSVTDGTPTFAANPTITALEAAINALGNGWTTSDQGYGAWPSADLYCPNGVSGGDSPNPSGQGALTAAGQFAELKLHTYELAGYQLDQRRGWLLRAIPYTDPELLHPEDLIWPVGINNFRVQYTAGFATVPEDVQEACAELVATWFQQRGQNLNMQSEDVASTYKYTRYMGFNPAAPMPANGTIPVLAMVAAYLKQHMKNGRMGCLDFAGPFTRGNLHWTHKLILDLRDVRDAYSAAMTAGPAEVVQNDDTVLVYDYLKPGQTCPFQVVHVNRKRSKVVGDILQVYLDRCLPGGWAGGGSSGGPSLPTVMTPCCPLGLPQTLYATLTNVSGAACLDGIVLPINYEGGNGFWQGSTAVPACIAGGVLTLLLQCSSPPLAGTCTSLNLSGSCRSDTASGLISNAFPLSCSCNPFTATFTGMTVQPGPNSCCPAGGTVQVVITP
jgi:hypothetical protein